MTLPMALFSILIFFFASSHVCLGELDKSKAVGPCIEGICPPKHFCAAGNECYPKLKVKRDNALGGGTVSIGPCVNGLCPNGFECINNICYKAKASPFPTREIGPCVNAKCPDGFSCNMAEYKCYAN